MCRRLLEGIDVGLIDNGERILDWNDISVQADKRLCERFINGYILKGY